jgi:hypothetical protein
MSAFRKSGFAAALAATCFAWVGGAHAQSFDGQYKGLLTCAKLTFTDAVLDNEPVDLKITNGKASYSRTLYGANRSQIVGKETGTGTVGADGTIALAGGWTGKRDSLKASYGGRLQGGTATLAGKHVVIYQGRSHDRSCTLTVKK